MDFRYRMRVFFAINGAVMLTIAASLWAQSAPAWLALVIWVAWFTLVQLIALLVSMNRKVPQLFPDAVDGEIGDMRRRAETGDRVAAYELGRSYEIGHGVSMDLERARHWYSLAAAKALPEARQAQERLQQAA